MLSIKPVLGTQIQTGHPLARGIAGCWLMNEGSGSYIYDSSGNGYIGTLGTGATSPTWSSNGLSFGANQSRIVTPAAAGFNSDSGSIEMLVRPAWNYDDGLYHFLWDTYGGNNCSFYIQKHPANYTSLFTDSTLRQNFTFHWAAGTVYHVVLNWGTNQLYINGVLEKTYEAGGLGNGSSTLYIGDRHASANYAFSGNIYYFIVRDVPLKQVEINQLYVDPYVMFQQRRRNILLNTS
ncbi:MAG: hypothetical protein IMZ47_04285 [Firmicutes bacterium]|nr:hypothetical protein [Bacillota bacterium]